MINDLRYSLRMLVRNPAFTTVAVLTLALGIGANVAIFSFLDQLLLRPLPVPKPRELAVLAIRFPDHTTYTFNYPLYEDYRERADLFQGMIAYQEQSISVTVDKLAERTRGLVVSENYFDVLGVRPVLGAAFPPTPRLADKESNGIVISHGWWQRRFASDPAVIGQVVHVNSQPFTILGVAPPHFCGTITTFIPEVYIPIQASSKLRPADMFESSALTARHYTWLHLLGRLKPGVARERAEAQLRSLATAIARTHPDSTATEIVLEDGSQGHHQRVDRAALPLILMQVVVGLLLLIACVNLANLLIARANSRQREIAIRLAVGATRARVVRHLMADSLLLAGAGGTAGLVLAVWLTAILAGFTPPHVPSPVHAGLDWRVLSYALVLSLGTGIVFGLLPAWQAGRSDPQSGLKAGPGECPACGRWPLRNALVVGQVALSLLVLIAAGLCLRSAQKAQAIHPGFEPSRVLLASLDVEAAGRPPAAGHQFYDQLLQQIRALPGVSAAGLARTVVLSGSSARISINEVEGYKPQAKEMLTFDYNVVTPEYFRALGTAFLHGRDFDERDREGAPRVVIINEIIAQRYWPGESPIGKRIAVPRMVAPMPAANSGTIMAVGKDSYEVIGVVQSAKYRSLTETPVAMMFWPFAQHYEPRLTLHIRSAAEPKALLASVRAVIRSLDPHLPLFNVQTLEEQRIGSLFLQRMAASTLSGFGLLALILTAVGIYGVMTYAVTRRTREIGIRMALGAQWNDVVHLIIREGLVLIGFGLSIGFAAALATSQVLRSFLVGISPVDPLTFLGLGFLLSAVALLACWWPARRAARVDPIVTLRAE